MSELPWSKFFWSDWEADQGLRLCSLAAQGLWMRMLCVCAKGDPKGYLAINGQPLGSTDVARLCGITADEAESLMDELDRNGVFSRDRRGWVYSRRMIRDAKKSAAGKKFAKRRWGQPPEDKGGNPRPNGSPNGEPTPQRPETRDQREEKGVARAPVPDPDPYDRPLPGSQQSNGWIPPGRMVEGFSLPPDGRSFAEAQGFAPADVQAISDDFARHYLAATGPKAHSANWRASWQRWVCREAQFRRDRARRSSLPGSATAAAGLARIHARYGVI